MGYQSKEIEADRLVTLVDVTRLADEMSEDNFLVSSRAWVINYPKVTSYSTPSNAEFRE